MSVREPDWAGFRQAVTARQRPIMEGLAEFLRLDTVSQKPDRVRTGAEWLRRAMRVRGLEAHVLETGGNPAVYGALPVPEAERTLLIYCHYDVKPAPPEGWLQTSPFEPVLRARAAEEGAPVLVNETLARRFDVVVIAGDSLDVSSIVARSLVFSMASYVK